MSTPAPLRIPYVNLAAQYAEERADLLPLIDNVLASAQYIDGPAVATLEQKLAELCGVKHAVGLNSGTDALVLALRALGIGPGDEVITPPNSFVASTAAIAHVGAIPVFADVLPDQNIDPDKVREAVTPRTRAIMPVHLTGRVCDMAPIMRLAHERGLFVVEDAAQSIGSTYDGRPAGSFGDAGCFSAHPLKNLAALGDAGFVTTNNAQIAEKVRLLRNHGLVNRNEVKEFGFVSRLDTLQATVLNFRLGRLDDVIRRRRENAARYRSLLDGSRIAVPQDRQIEFNTHHTAHVHTMNNTCSWCEQSTSMVLRGLQDVEFTIRRQRPDWEVRPKAAFASSTSAVHRSRGVSADALHPRRSSGWNKNHLVAIHDHAIRHPTTLTRIFSASPDGEPRHIPATSAVFLRLRAQQSTHFFLSRQIAARTVLTFFHRNARVVRSPR